MTREHNWEPIDYHHLPNWMKRVSKPRRWIKRTYTKIFYGKPYNYKVLYDISHGKLHIRYWRSPNTHTKKSESNPIFGILFIAILVGAFWFLFMNPTSPTTDIVSQNLTSNVTLPTTTGISTIRTPVITKIPTPTPPPATTIQYYTSPKTSDIEQWILKYTNEERAKAGKQPLSWDAKLVTIARDHSEDMAEEGYFSHDNFAGEDPTDRAIRQGYSVRKPLGDGSYKVGISENIGKMPTGNVIGIGYVENNAESVARAQVNSWMDSYGHRQNILDSTCSNIGIGVAYDGFYYVSTQDFW